MNCQGDACDYRITWNYDAASGKIQFNINAKTDMDKWTGVAFSKQGQMVWRQVFFTIASLYEGNCLQSFVTEIIDKLKQNGLTQT